MIGAADSAQHVAHAGIGGVRDVHHHAERVGAPDDALAERRSSPTFSEAGVSPSSFSRPELVQMSLWPVCVRPR